MARRMEWRGAGADARVVFGMGMPWGRRLRRSTTFQLSDSYQIWKSLLEYRQRFLQIVTYGCTKFQIVTHQRIVPSPILHARAAASRAATSTLSSGWLPVDTSSQVSYKQAGSLDGCALAGCLPGWSGRDAT